MGKTLQNELSKTTPEKTFPMYTNFQPITEITRKTATCYLKRNTNKTQAKHKQNTHYQDESA